MTQPFHAVLYLTSCAHSTRNPVSTKITQRDCLLFHYRAARKNCETDLLPDFGHSVQEASHSAKLSVGCGFPN